MVKTTKYGYFIYGFILSVLSLFFSCAVQVAPTGGPKDLSGPQMTESVPLDKTINYNGAKIKFTFDEYIKLVKPKDNIIFSPPIENIKESYVVGKSLFIVLEDTLRLDYTYELLLANAVKDENEGNLLKAQKILFSTGEVLDTLIVRLTSIRHPYLLPIWEIDVPNHGELTAITVTEKGYFLSGHKEDQSGGIDASISMISHSGKFVWNKTFGNPTGGDLIFSGLDSGNRKLIYDECWGITQFRNGLVLACGTGIEECVELSDNLLLTCEDDPRTTWRSYLVHVDFSGNLVWHRASSFMFDDEDEEDVPSTASEWVFTTANGDLASVVDLSFGMGIEVLR